MKILRWLTAAAACAQLTASAVTDDWHPAIGPLTTRWTKEVSPANVWPEYPRPQMVRKDWLNLNGLWQYTIIPTNTAAPLSYQGRILVPFPVESALSGVMRRLDEKSHLFYKRTFSVPKEWSGQRILLHFGAVDWETKVRINGQEAGTHRGGYDAFTFDITSALKPGPSQEIIIDVFDPTEGGQARGKQVRQPNGIWYTPTSGIWQTVWLERVPDTSVEDLRMIPDVDNSVLRLSAELRGGQGTEVLEAAAFENGQEVGRATGPAGTELQVPLLHPHLWSPAHPFLYDLQVQVRRGSKPLDMVTSYFAMRKISLGTDQRGIVRPKLNGRPIFQIGTLDQGFWPDGIYTAPTDAAMRYDLEVTKKLGFNMVRKHTKVEPDRWYYDCDKLGLLVWQDMPGAYLGNRTPPEKDQFETELRQMITTHFNHPCIVQWVLFNEGWGEYDAERLTGLIEEMDPSRLVDDASGWTDKKAGDIIDRHHYPAPVWPALELHRAAVQGEFGGLGLPLDGHTWTKKSWGYQGMGTRQALTARYVELMGNVSELETEAGLSAAVYTQTTDVETECNGLMMYDREILKPVASAVAAANRKLRESGR